MKETTRGDMAMFVAMSLWLMATLTLACLPIFLTEGYIELWFGLCIFFGFGGIVSMALGFILE